MILACHGSLWPLACLALLLWFVIVFYGLWLDTVCYFLDLLVSIIMFSRYSLSWLVIVYACYGLQWLPYKTLYSQDSSIYCHMYRGNCTSLCNENLSLLCTHKCRVYFYTENKNKK